MIVWFLVWCLQTWQPAEVKQTGRDNNMEEGKTAWFRFSIIIVVAQVRTYSTVHFTSSSFIWLYWASHTDKAKTELLIFFFSNVIKGKNTDITLTLVFRPVPLSHLKYTGALSSHLQWSYVRWSYTLTGVQLWFQLTAHDVDRHTRLYKVSHH